MKELPSSREKSFCCGAGRGWMFMEETIGKRINFERTDEIIGAGVQTIAVACLYCATMLVNGISDRKSDIAVIDLAVNLDEATD